MWLDLHGVGDTKNSDLASVCSIGSTLIESGNSFGVQCNYDSMSTNEGVLCSEFE